MIDDRIKFRHLQCFLAVMQQGSLQKAADVLAISQPAVSKTLKELEALLLEVRLFERGRKGAVMTREGEAFARHAGASVSALREAVASVARTRREGSALVSIGVLPTVAPWLMPRLLVALDGAAASNLRIHTGANPELLAQLRQRELDLVIGRFAEPAYMLGLTFEHLYADPLVLAVRPSHPLLNEASLRLDPLAHLAAFSVILPTQNTAIRHTADSFLLTRGLGPLARTIETLSVSVARGYTLASDAVWLTPLGAARPDLDSGALQQVPVGMDGTDELVGLTLRADMAATPVQQAVIDAIRRLAAGRREETSAESRSA
ncbi:MAG: pca operon transcription factor PcaQ [Polaromonas sp.]|nr:pca operon transcription factor PcaQ [Polaromonas sp.]